MELYTDELRDLSGGPSDDLFQLIGVHLARARHELTPLRAFRNRFPWLMCNVMGGVAAAFLCGLFEAELKRAVTLALFIPVVLALAESMAGVQDDQLDLTDFPRHATFLARDLSEGRIRELLVGLLLGGGSGFVVGCVALTWLGQWSLAFCGVGRRDGRRGQRGRAGRYGCRLLRRLRLDPQVAAGPLVLALTDIIIPWCATSN